MDNQEFRGILLKLQDRLSDNDRRRLHFFFGNDVPRRIRDDPSLSGTLSLMESLFDQDKINEQDFTVLIKAFNEIRCLDAAKLLQDHMKRMESNGPKTTLECLSSIMPHTLNQLLQDQVDDKINVKTNCLHQQNMCTYNNNIIDSNHTNINPVTLVLNHQSDSHLLSTTKNFLSHTPIIQICLVLSTIVSIIILTILTGFYIHRSSRIDELEKDLQMKNKIIIEEQMKNNQTIQMLNDRIKDLEKEKETSFTRAGIKFGGIGGGPFDDSFIRNFTCSHYLRGMIARRGVFKSDWYQFLYSSSYHPDDIIEADIRGTRPKTDISERFLLGKDEKIYKVQVVYYNASYNIHNVLTNASVIRGVRLFTTKGRASPSLDQAEGTTTTEQFDGYIVGYVSGRAGLAVDQIQFHWHRMVVGP